MPQNVCSELLIVNYGNMKGVLEDMGKKRTQKSKTKMKKKFSNYYFYNDCDPNLPDAPKIKVYQETFGGLIDITEQWYKENEG